jgi:hypothetical protein
MAAASNIYGTAKVVGATLAVQQNSFFLYHRNSYANNKSMLKSAKPLIMRDLFLTKNNAYVANPLSALYVQDIPTMLVNCSMSAVYALGLVPIVGARLFLATWFGGAWVSGMAYLFQCNVNPRRLDSEFDVAATSVGGFAALGAMSLFVLSAKAPLINAPLHYIAFPHLLWCLAQEYVLPRFDHEKRKGVAYLGNEGTIGGIFFGLMMGTMFVKRRTDARAVQAFFDNVKTPAK